MKKGFLSALLLATGIMTTSVHASEGLYVKAAYGNTDFEEFKTNRTISFSLGYQFNQFIAIDLNHTNYGEIDLSDSLFDSSLETSANSLSAIASLPLHERFSAYAKLGVANWAIDVDVSLQGEGVSVTNETDGTVLVSGLGIETHFDDTFSATIEYELLTVDPVDVDVDIETIEFGVKIVF